jgi:hypothetical protein
MKCILPIIVLFLISVSAFSQKNAVKVGLTGISYGNYSLNYERHITKNQSININGSFWDLDLGFVPTNLLFTPSDGVELSELKKGFHASIDYRIYVNTNIALHGFYVAPYLRYWQYNFTMHDEINGMDFNMNSSAISAGAGFSIGYQWIIKDHFTIDWTFIGLGIERIMYNGNYITANNSSYNYSSISTDVHKVFEGWNYFEKRLKTTPHPDRLNVKLPFWSPGIKSGFSLGYAF